MGEKSENCGVPEDLFNGLKVTDTQEAECAGLPVPDPKVSIPRVSCSGMMRPISRRTREKRSVFMIAVPHLRRSQERTRLRTNLMKM